MCVVRRAWVRRYDRRCKDRTVDLPRYARLSLPTLCHKPNQPDTHHVVAHALVPHSWYLHRRYRYVPAPFSGVSQNIKRCDLVEPGPAYVTWLSLWHCQAQPGRPFRSSYCYGFETGLFWSVLVWNLRRSDRCNWSDRISPVKSAQQQQL